MEAAADRKAGAARAAALKNATPNKAQAQRQDSMNRMPNMAQARPMGYAGQRPANAWTPSVSGMHVLIRRSTPLVRLSVAFMRDHGQTN